MNLSEKSNKATAAFLFFLTLFLWSCTHKNTQGLIIATEYPELPAGSETTDSIKANSFNGSRIILINPLNSADKAEVLTKEFAGARSPEISFDGKHMIFSGKKSANDHWQIWEMALEGSGFRQITNSDFDAVDPSYLPGGRIVYTASPSADSLMTKGFLATCNLDASANQRITYSPSSFFRSAVLSDGRILAISQETFPKNKTRVLTVMRPDGTKADLFYSPHNGLEVKNKACEIADGRIFFIESTPASTNSGRLTSIKYSRPLHSATYYDNNTSTGDYHSVSAYTNGNLLVSFRPTDNEKYSLYSYDTETKTLSGPIYSDPEFHIAEAVLIRDHERPRKLPSEVDPLVKTGLILCQNINVSGMAAPSSLKTIKKADRIEVLGIKSSLGFVEAEKDGSFYLKVAADMPFRIRTLDSLGREVNSPGGWYWLRPNERRGCVGCHEDREITPANKYTTAVSKKPVAIPVHIKGIREKEIELE